MANKAAHLQNGTVYIDPSQIKLIIFDKDGTLSDLNMWIEIIKQRARLLGEHFELPAEKVDDIIRAMGADPYSTNILDVAILTDSRPTTEKKVINKTHRIWIRNKMKLTRQRIAFLVEVDSIVDLRKIATPAWKYQGIV